MSTRASARSTYFPSGSSSSFMRMSPGLLRARQPFLVRNALTGAVIVAFAASVYFYSIKAVSQDDFSGEDIKALQAEQAALKLGRSGSLSVGPSPASFASDPNDKKTQQSIAMQAAVDLESSILGAGPVGTRDRAQPLSANASSHAGQTWATIFQGRDASRSLVQGASSVDRLGLISDRRALATDRRMV